VTHVIKRHGGHVTVIKKSIVAAALLLLLWPVTIQADNGGIQPDWELGSSWEVTTRYQGQDHGTWSTSVVWRYTVVAVPGRESTGYMLDVKMSHGGTGVTAQLLYREDYSLERVTIIRAIDGRKRQSSFTYDAGAPVMTSGSPFPFDTPLFPLVSPSKEIYETNRHMADGLSYRVGIRQTVVHDTDDGDSLRVTCEASSGNSFRQCWVPGVPWPVEGENAAMKYELVEQ